MTKKTPKLLKTITILSLFTLGILYANNSNKKADKQIDYKKMSTTELQIEVERLSNAGKLPFEMGLELINRWTNKTKEVN